MVAGDLSERSLSESGIARELAKYVKRNTYITREDPQLFDKIVGAVPKRKRNEKEEEDGEEEASVNN